MPDEAPRPEMPKDPYHAFDESWTPLSDPYKANRRPNPKPPRVPFRIWLALAAFLGAMIALSILASR
jgi:hypothetical protein